MNLILMVLRLVLNMLFPSRRDGLSLAARTDGRTEHLRQSPWAWLLGEMLLGETSDRPAPGRPELRSKQGRASPQRDRSGPAATPPPPANG
jgi:hypothetical protein